MTINFLLIFVSIGAVLGLIVTDIKNERKLEGLAKTALIMQFQGIEVSPDQARFTQIVITTTDVQISMAQAKINIFEVD